MVLVVAVGLALVGAQPALKVQTLTPGLTVSCPATLKTTPVEKVDDPGMTNFRVWKGVSGFSSYVVSIDDIKEPDKMETSEVLSGAMGGMLASAENNGREAKIVGVRDVLLQGWPGLAATVRTSDGLAFSGRYFRTKDHFIQIGCAYPWDAKPAAVDPFLSSLKLDTTGTKQKPGPELNRFDMGDSGLTALFPRKPETHTGKVGKGDTQVPIYTFASDYGLRSFEVAYSDVSPKASTDDASNKTYCKYITDDTLKSLDGTAGKQTDIQLNGSPALRTEFTIGDDGKGVMVASVKDRRAIMLVEFAPTTYDDPATAETFLNSLQPKPAPTTPDAPKTTGG